MFISCRPNSLPKAGFLSVNPTYFRRRSEFVSKTFVVRGDQGEESEKNMVDDNMFVLRMRIKKMKVLEGSARRYQEPSLDGENGLFGCEAMEVMKSSLTKSRPSVVLGLLALLAMSVPFPSSDVLSTALNMARGLLAGCHVSIDIDF